MELSPIERQQKAMELIEMAKQGIDVSEADPRETSSEAVIVANRILRSRGELAIKRVQSAL